MKKFWLIILTLLMAGAALPAAAQESCITDLGPVAAQVVQAQALASSGDAQGSVAAMREARAALAAIQSACAEAGVSPVVLLDGEFVSPGGAFTFNYPLEWVTGATQRPNPDTLVQPLGNSTRAAEQALQGEPLLAPGEQAAFVAGGNRQTFNMQPDSTPADVLRAIVAGLPVNFSAGDVTETTLNSLPAAAVRYSGPGFDGYLVVRIVSQELGLVAEVAGFTPPGELEPLVPVIDAIARSVR
jgi:sugar (pentulose or hexulose) kinase